MISNDIILGNIISRLETRPLRKCLRVSLQFFHIAGKYLYTNITYPPDNGDKDLGRAAQRLFEGWNASSPECLRDSGDDSNFKRILLGMVRQLTIKTHSHSICLSLTNAAEAFKRLDVLIIIPPGTQVSPKNSVCQNSPVRHGDIQHSYHCPLATMLAPRHIVYRNLKRSELPILFTMAKKRSILESVTYIIPTSMFLSGGLSIVRGTPFEYRFEPAHVLD